MTYEEARAAVHANPDDVGAWFALGVLEEEAGYTAQARASYRRAVLLNPHMQEALAALTRLQEERVLAYARDSLADRDFQEDSSNPPSFRPIPLLALLLLFLGVVTFFYLNFRGQAVTPSDPTNGALEADAPTPTVASSIPASPTATLQPTSIAPVQAVTATLLPTVVPPEEATLHNSHFQATTRLFAPISSSTQVRFDPGRGREVPRLHRMTTDGSPESSQTME